MKNGYTLTEALVTMIILGVIAALTIPVIAMRFGNNNNVLYKTAFLTAHNTVSDLAQDLNLYPSGLLDIPASGNFCTNFASRINTIGTVNCALDRAYALGVPNFTTTNGMKWYFYPQSNPNFNSSAGYAVSIWVDINGNQAPNTLGTDILVITAYRSGKIEALTNPEMTYLAQ